MGHFNNEEAFIKKTVNLQRRADGPWSQVYYCWPYPTSHVDWQILYCCMIRSVCKCPTQIPGSQKRILSLSSEYKEQFDSPYHDDFQVAGLCYLQKTFAVQGTVTISHLRYPSLTLVCCCETRLNQPMHNLFDERTSRRKEGQVSSSWVLRFPPHYWCFEKLYKDGVTAWTDLTFF